MSKMAIKFSVKVGEYHYGVMGILLENCDESSPSNLYKLKLHNNAPGTFVNTISFINANEIDGLGKDEHWITIPDPIHNYLVNKAIVKSSSGITRIMNVVILGDDSDIEVNPFDSFVSGTGEVNIVARIDSDFNWPNTTIEADNDYNHTIGINGQFFMAKHDNERLCDLMSQIPENNLEILLVMLNERTGLFETHTQFIEDSELILQGFIFPDKESCNAYLAVIADTGKGDPEMHFERLSLNCEFYRLINE